MIFGESEGCVSLFDMMRKEVISKKKFEGLEIMNVIKLKNKYEVVILASKQGVKFCRIQFRWLTGYYLSLS